MLALSELNSTEMPTFEGLGSMATLNSWTFSSAIACVDFERAQFSRCADFLMTRFDGDAKFLNAKFGKNANFNEAIFGEYADFAESQFDGDANFLIVEFNDDANFLRAGFNDDPDSPCKNADFSYAQFDKEAYFNDAQFNGSAYFTSCWFKGDALFEGTIFRGELSLTRARYDKLFIRWYNIKRGLIYDDTAYLSLLKNFKDLGYLEDYDSCYFEYRKERRSHPWPLVGDGEEAIRKGVDILLEWFYGYGTKPLNTIYFSFGIIIGFGIFWRIIGLGKKDHLVYENGRIDTRIYEMPEVLDFSAKVFLSGMRLFIEPPSHPKIRGRSRYLVGGAFYFERVLGALFFVLFFLAISGTIVR